MNWLSDKILGHLREVADAPDLSDTRYQLREKLGRGGMGSVFLVTDSELQRQVALKVLDIPDQDNHLSERMIEEARIIARLEHPGIVPVHDVGSLPDGRVFYTMKYVQGERLDNAIKSVTAISERLRIFRKICEPVAFAHAHGVIHRDLKPANIMIGDFGETLVMDWGIAKVLNPSSSSQSSQNDASASFSKNDTSRTLSGTILGTPGYMAPEQAAGDISAINQQSDIYALGALLFFLLSGEPPPQITRATTSPKKILQLLTKVSGKTVNIPKPLKYICQKAMSVSPEDRYPTVQALIGDIDKFLDDMAISAYKENIIELSQRFFKKHKFFVGLILTYLILRYLMIVWLNV